MGGVTGYRDLVFRVLPVEPGEGRRLRSLVAANFLLICGVTLGRNVRDSLFLKNFGLANLPYMYAATPLLVVACSYLYGRFVRRLERASFLTASFCFYAALIAVSHALLLRGLHWFYPALYMAVQAVWALSLMELWTVAAEMFDVRQARRLFPFVTAGGLLGMAAVGLSSRPLVRWMGTPNLLLVWIPCLAGAWALLRGSLERRHRDVAPARAGRALAAAAPSRRAELPASPRLTGGRRLLRAMGGISLAGSIVFVLVDFQFNAVMNATYPSQDALTSFLGAFRGWAGVGALLLQLFLTPWLVSRYGAGRGILVHPAVMLAAGSTLLLRFGYASVMAAKFVDQVLLYTLQESSFQLLYNPLPPNRRARARTLIEGYFKPLMGGVGGLLLVAATTQRWGLRNISLMVVLLAALWALASYRVGGAYLEALVANLAKQPGSQRATAAEAIARLKDRESLERLFSAIRQATREQALLAIQFLERFGQPDAQAMLGTLAGHPEAAIRATAVASLGRLRHPSLVPLLPRLAQDPDARVRANALEALPVAEAGAHRALLQICLQDPHPRVRASAIRLLVALADSADSAHSRDQLLEMARSMCADADPLTRGAGVYALAAFPGKMATSPLIDLLANPAAAPWRQELRALAEVGDESAVEAILVAVRICPAARPEAHHALLEIHARQPQEVITALLELLRLPERVGLRPEILRVLGRIGDPAVLPALAEPLASHDVYVRSRALAGVERFGENHPLPPEVVEAVRVVAQEEIRALEAAAAYARSVAAHVPEESARLLAESLREETTHIQGRIFRALGIVFDRAGVALIARQFRRAGGAPERAHALEALEYLAGPELGRPLVRVLESRDGPVPPLREVLGILAAHPVAWIRACTALVIGRGGLAEYAHLLKGLRQSAEPMVREAALYSMCRLAARLHGEGEAQFLARSALGDPHPLVRDTAEKMVQEKAVLLAVEKVLFLKSVSLFASLEGEELARLAEICSEQEMAAGTLVFQENDDAHNLYVIVSGRVKVFRGAAPRETRLAELGERECFGEMALLDEEPRSASVLTLDPCRFLKIRGDDFRELVLERPQISLAIMRLLSSRLRHMDVEAEAQPVFLAAREYV